MAATRCSLAVFSLGVLLAGGFKLPTASPLVQDGSGGKDTGPHRSAETAASAPIAAHKWEWKASSGEGGREQPLAARQKREEKMASRSSPEKETSKKGVPVANTTAGVPTSGLIQKGNLTELLPDVTLSSVPLGKVPQEGEEATNSNEVLHVETAEHAVPSPTLKSGHFGGKGLPVMTQSPSPAPPVATEKLNVSLVEARTAPAATEHWPWLEDQTSASSQTPGEGVDVSTAFSRLKTVSSPTAEWPWMRGLSTASSLTSMIDLLDVSTAALKGGTDARQPRLRSKGNDGGSPQKVDATPKAVWSWLDEASTNSPPTWAGDSDVSAATPGQTSGTEKTTSRWRRRTNPLLGTATVRGPKSATAITTSPSTVPPRGNSSLLSQCLLAISLLGLVAAIFIVAAGILAALLWRQKRAYKRDSRRPTEMVCISSLLATEEADEARKRQARVKRVKMLVDSNGFETETDNLTLNSFLPEH